MKKWLQRTVGTAGVACGIALAASGIASANGDQPVELGTPLGSIGSETSAADAPPVAGGLPVVGGPNQGGDMVGSAVKSTAVPIRPGAKIVAAKPENVIGMGADLVGSKRLGDGVVGGLRDDVARPAEDLPVAAQLPVVGQLGNAVPMGSTPLSAGTLGTE